MREIIAALLGKAESDVHSPKLRLRPSTLVPLYGTTQAFVIAEAERHRTRVIVGLGGLLIGTGILALLGDMLGLVVYAILCIYFTVVFVSAGVFVWGGLLTAGAYTLGVLLPGLGVILAAVLTYRLTEIVKGERAPRELVRPPHDAALPSGRPATWAKADSHPKTHPNFTNR